MKVDFPTPGAPVTPTHKASRKTDVPASLWIVDASIPKSSIIDIPRATSRSDLADSCNMTPRACSFSKVVAPVDFTI
jgi:hypothetical protein